MGAGPRVLRALLAAADADRPGRAGVTVVVGGSTAAVQAAAWLLAPAGRLAAPSVDEASAHRVASAAGLVVRHVVRLPDGVVWSGRRHTAAPHRSP